MGKITHILDKTLTEMLQANVDQLKELKKITRELRKLNDQQ